MSVLEKIINNFSWYLLGNNLADSVLVKISRLLYGSFDLYRYTDSSGLFFLPLINPMILSNLIISLLELSNV